MEGNISIGVPNKKAILTILTTRHQNLEMKVLKSVITEQIERLDS